jgi:hypothetical protein
MLEAKADSIINENRDILYRVDLDIRGINSHRIISVLLGLTVTFFFNLDPAN